MEEPSRGQHFPSATYSMKLNELEFDRQRLARRQNYPDVQSIQSARHSLDHDHVAFSGRSDSEVERNSVSSRCFSSVSAHFSLRCFLYMWPPMQAS